MPRRVLLVLNRRSRRGREMAPVCADRLREAGLDPVEEEVPPGRFREAILRHRGEVDAVVIGGGDGTLSSALEGLLEADLPLGVLPLGTANNVARTLGIPTAPEEAAAVIAAGCERRIDLGRVNGKHFLTTASLGLSVDITERLTAELKRRWGPLAYGLAAVRTLMRLRLFHAEIRWEGGAVRSRTVQIVVGNGRYYGSALPVAADAQIDDQALDLYSIETHHWWQVLALAPALLRGSHGEKRTVQSIRARWFEVRTRVPRPINVDGEIGVNGELGPTTPARFDVVPEALRIFCPDARP